MAGINADRLSHRWWSVFWVLFQAKNNQNGTSSQDAMTYIHVRPTNGFHLPCRFDIDIFLRRLACAPDPAHFPRALPYPHQVASIPLDSDSPPIPANNPRTVARHRHLILRHRSTPQWVRFPPAVSDLGRRPGSPSPRHLRANSASHRSRNPGRANRRARQHRRARLAQACTPKAQRWRILLQPSVMARLIYKLWARHRCRATRKVECPRLGTRRSI